MSETRCRNANSWAAESSREMQHRSLQRLSDSETRQRHGYACRVGEEAAGGAVTRAYVRPR
jgi:hypothetical protein